MHVCVVGLGYVGLVTAATLAEIGHRVVGCDTDARKLELLERGDIPIYEPALPELIQANRERGRLHFANQVDAGVSQAEVIFIAVGTPSKAEGEPDMQFVGSAAKAIGMALDRRRFRVIVNKSTVPVGSGNWVEKLIEEASKLNGVLVEEHFAVASNPEFLREGSAVHDSLYPDRIVIGSHVPQATAILRALYEPIVEQKFPAPLQALRPENIERIPLMVTDLISAELVKYATNAFLATKISFANELANICERVGANVTEVTRGMGLDSRIGHRFLDAGIGWGGSCFGKDISALIYLAHEYGYEPELLKASRALNYRQRQLLLQKVLDLVKGVRGKTIGIMGLAFKPNTDDLRDAPSITLVDRLLAMGARVKVYDPVVGPETRIVQEGVHFATDLVGLARDCDALVLVTEWDEFRKVDLRQLAGVMRQANLVDGRNLWSPDEARAAGFDYRGVGRT